MNETDQQSVETLVATANQEAVVEEIEVDALTEALDTISKAMAKPKPQKGSMQVSLFDDDMDDEDMDDEDMDDEDMEKAMSDLYADAMKAMAQGTDAIVADMEKRMNAVLKGMEAMLGEMKAMKAEQGAMAKSLNATMSAPVPPRAVTHASVAEVAPVAPTASRGEMIRKALTKIQDASTDAHTRYRLRTAIAQLESGAPLSDISDFIG